jgi:hypothetical protein
MNISVWGVNVVFIAWRFRRIGNVSQTKVFPLLHDFTRVQL